MGMFEDLLNGSSNDNDEQKMPGQPASGNGERRGTEFTPNNVIRKDIRLPAGEDEKGKSRYVTFHLVGNEKNVETYERYVYAMSGYESDKNGKPTKIEKGKEDVNKEWLKTAYGMLPGKSNVFVSDHPENVPKEMRAEFYDNLKAPKDPHYSAPGGYTKLIIPPLIGVDKKTQETANHTAYMVLNEPAIYKADRQTNGDGQTNGVGPKRGIETFIHELHHIHGENRAVRGDVVKWKKDYVPDLPGTDHKSREWQAGVNEHIHRAGGRWGGAMQNGDIERGALPPQIPTGRQGYRQGDGDEFKTGDPTSSQGRVALQNLGVSPAPGVVNSGREVASERAL
jgi:hypothetical protein